jgi:excisionase family DNA binding protein
VIADTSPRGIDRHTRFDDLPEFLSPDEFRAYMRLSRSTVYDLLRRDELPHVKFGRCIRIPKIALRPTPTHRVE